MLELIQSLEGDPARAGEVRLPGLRSDHPRGCPLVPHRAWTCRAQARCPCLSPDSACTYRSIVRATSSARRHRARCVDACRLDGRRSGNLAARRPNSRPCLPAERAHVDDTTVPAWQRLRPGTAAPEPRDNRPFTGPDSPTAVFFYSPDRGGRQDANETFHWSFVECARRSG